MDTLPFLSYEKRYAVYVYEKIDRFCSEIVDKDTNQILITLDGFEIKGLNDMHGYVLANKDNQFIYYNLYDHSSNVLS